MSKVQTRIFSQGAQFELPDFLLSGLCFSPEGKVEKAGWLRCVWHTLEPGPDLPSPLKFDQEKNQPIITNEGEEEGFFRSAQGRPASKLADQVT